MRTKEEIKRGVNALKMILDNKTKATSAINNPLARVVIKMQCEALEWTLGYNNDFHGPLMTLLDDIQKEGLYNLNDLTPIDKGQRFCPYCLVTFTGPIEAEVMEGTTAKPPTGGKVFLCDNCAGICIFNEDLSLRKIEFDELKDLCMNDDFRIHLFKGRDEILRRNRR